MCSLLLLLAGWAVTLTRAGNVPDAEQLLSLHNFYRSNHGSPPLAWSTSIAASATRHAQRCTWQHSSSQDRNGYGENLYFSKGMDVPTIGARASKEWYEEVKDYNFGSPGQALRYGAMIGHFTAMVWADTKAIGCAYVRCPWLANGGYSDVDLLVCQYDPPGNIVAPNYYAANVRPYGTPVFPALLPPPSPVPPVVPLTSPSPATVGQLVPVPAPTRAPAAPQPTPPRSAPRPTPQKTSNDPWHNAPACSGSPTKTNSVTDSKGRKWGFQRGVSCAFKAIRPPQAAPAAPAAKPGQHKTPAVQKRPARPAEQPKSAWDSAPACRGQPNKYNGVKDSQGKLWGFQNGVSCAYKRPANVVAEASKSGRPPTGWLPAASRPSGPRASTMKPSGAQWALTGNAVFDAAPACEGQPTASNSVSDSQGRKWGLLRGVSCAFKVLASASSRPQAAARAAAASSLGAAAPSSRAVLDAWEVAPACRRGPDSQWVADSKAKKWGLEDGIRCAYKGKANSTATTNKAAVRQQPQQQPVPSSRPRTPAEVRSAPQWVLTGDAIFDAAQACEGQPTPNNTVTDSLGLKWGLLRGTPCAHKTLARSGAVKAAPTAVAPAAATVNRMKANGGPSAPAATLAAPMMVASTAVVQAATAPLPVLTTPAAVTPAAVLQPVPISTDWSRPSWSDRG